MKLPVTVKLTTTPSTSVVGDWLRSRDILTKVSYDWHKKTLSFEDEEDAIAFCLTFGADRIETTVERMIKNA